MKKEIFLSAISAIFGGAASLGGNFIQVKYLTDPQPIAVEAEKITNINNNLLDQHRNLILKIDDMVDKNKENTQIENDLIKIRDEVNSIFNTSGNFVQSTKSFTTIAESISRDVNSYFSSTPDLQLRQGQAATVCGQENTLGVIEDNKNDNSIRINLNSDSHRTYPGKEYAFNSPKGISMISYLGVENSLYKFRVTCNTKTKKT